MQELAEQGDAQAQYTLGNWYRLGKFGVPQAIEAQRWYDRAAATFPPGADRDKAIQASELLIPQVSREQAAAQAERQAALIRITIIGPKDCPNCGLDRSADLGP